MSPVTIRLVNAVLLGMTDVESLSDEDRAEVTRELVRRGWSAQQDAGGFRESNASKVYEPAADEPQCLGDARFTTYPVPPALLLICNKCQLKAACRDIVQPDNSAFDGVCAGAIYRNGKRVAK